MRKQLQKDNEGLKVYFTKKELLMYGMVEGDVIDLSDMLKQEEVKNVKEKKQIH